MSRIILLDSGPLGFVTYPSAAPSYTACSLWLEDLLHQGVDVRIPEICDYEVRRGFLRVNQNLGVARLNALQTALGYIPITTATMLHAAMLWAQIRQQGLATAADKALDGDMILAARAAELSHQGHTVIIATTNVGHLQHAAVAEDWQKVTP